MCQRKKSLQEMVNTRAKTLKASFSQASVEDSDSDHQPIQALIGSNDDLLTEIFLRLPVTSILRFKSVSKHWRFLLSHRYFTLRYDSLSKSPGLFARHTYVPFDVQNPTPPPFRSLDSYFDLPGVRILQSCNGLLLCCTDRGPKGGKAACRYYVFNPTTKQLETIPYVPGGHSVRKTICLMGLAFHQTACPRYKVVCIRSLDSRMELFQIQVYSSDTKKWKVSVESFSANRPVFRQAVYWNGAVYWAPLYGSPMYFRIDVEQLQTLPLPEGLVPSKIMPMGLKESRGHMHLIVPEDNTLRLNVYEMLSGHSGWSVKYRVMLGELLDDFPEMISPYGYHFSLIDVVRGEEEEDTFVVMTIRKKIITYNVYDKSFKQIFCLPCKYEGLLSFHRYTEGLTAF